MKGKSAQAAITLFWVIFLLFAQKAKAAVVFNEIAAYESSGCEWIELYNTGPAAVDVQGWRFWEQNTNHGLSISASSSGQDWTVEQGEFAIITQNDAQLFSGACGDYAPPAGTVFDSSWGSLNESGELIGLKRADNTMEEEFSYTSASHFSLERKDATFSLYTAENWHEHASGNTFGYPNSSLSSIPVLEPAEALSPPPPPPPPAEPATLSPPQAPLRLVINEFVSDPAIGEGEWMEVYNLSENDGDLSGWTLRDGVNEIAALSGAISSRGFFVVSWSGSKLNNAGDAILLVNPFGATVDRVSYGDWLDGEDGDGTDNAPAPAKGNAVGRLQDGHDTNRDNGDYLETTRVTKGGPNTIVQPATPAPPIAVTMPTDTLPKETVSPSLKVSPVLPLQTQPGATPPRSSQATLLLINEILPNPLGDDSTGEFIELWNPTLDPIDLSGMRIDDGDGGSAPYDIPSGVLLPGSFAVFWSKDTHISLQNEEDMVRLFDSFGSVLREVAYEDVEEGMAMMRNDDGSWEGSATPTPGEKNRLMREARKPTADVPSSGGLATLQGVVVVPPGVFGAQYFYVLKDDGRAVQIYLHNKQFPRLSVGDRIRATGIMGEAYGEERFNAKKPGTIEVLSEGEGPEPRLLGIADLNTEDQGTLVTISGDITEVKRMEAYMDDGEGEIRLVFKKGAGIDTSRFALGDRVTVTGLLRASGGDYELLPRSDADILIASTDEAVLGADDATGAMPYAVAGAAGAGSFLLGLFGRARLLEFLARLRSGMAMAGSLVSFGKRDAKDSEPPL